MVSFSKPFLNLELLFKINEMQDSIFNQEVENLDLSKVAALQQKRTIAFINHFVLTNIQFLNNFVKICEQKLLHFERKIEKVEAAMVLLEAKLSSIPEVNQQQSIEPATESENVQIDTTASKPDTEENCDINIETDNKIEEQQIPSDYVKFLKMVQVGVPLEAVKLKISVEGLDPNILLKFI